MNDISAVRALTFDVFGTVVDWRASIIAEGRRLGDRLGVTVDWHEFALAWRAGYQPAMQRVRTGEIPWAKIDDLHRVILDELLVEYDISGLSESDVAHLNRVWHRLTPWSDSVPGLQRMRNAYVLATLSNGNVSLLVNMAKRAGLPWDCILSAELVRHYKPDLEVYVAAAELLSLHPSQIIMVAAHNADLRAARDVGFKTAFVARPLEYGPGQTTDLEAEPFADVVADDLAELANIVCP